MRTPRGRYLISGRSIEAQDNVSRFTALVGDKKLLYDCSDIQDSDLVAVVITEHGAGSLTPLLARQSKHTLDLVYGSASPRRFSKVKGASTT